MATTDKTKKAPTLKQAGKQSAKEKAAERKRRQQQQQTILLTVGAVGLLVAVIVIVFVSTRPPTADVSAAVQTHYTDLAQAGLIGTTPDGYPFMGKADAPVVMEEFASFACPFCLRFHQHVQDSLVDKIKAGDLKYVIVPVVHIDYDTTVETRGALCAGQQGKFWEFHDVLFDWQSSLPSTDKSPQLLSAAASKLGLDTGKFDACMNSDFGKDLIAKDEGRIKDIPEFGTPRIEINGDYVPDSDYAGQQVSEIRGVVEDKLAKLKAASAPTAQPTAAATTPSTTAPTTKPTAAATTVQYF